MDCTWPGFTTSLRTDFDRPRLRRRKPALLHDAIGLRLWGFRMDMEGHRDPLTAAAKEMNRQRLAGALLPCDDCGFSTPVWELDSRGTEHGAPHFRHGREVLRCPACWLAVSVGLDSRLDFGRAPVTFGAEVRT